MDPALWSFLPLGYLCTVLIEIPILGVGLSPVHKIQDRLIAGLWLTACTYPIVILVLPQLFSPTTDRWLYLLVAETFAPLAECGLFWLAYHRALPAGQRLLPRDFATIVAANLASFAAGEIYYSFA